MTMTRQEIVIAATGLDAEGAFLTAWRLAYRDTLDPSWWRRHLNAALSGDTMTSLDDFVGRVT